MADILTQTRLPPDLADWLKGEAEKEGEAISSYLRRLVFRAAGRAHADAWIRPVGVDIAGVHEADETPDLDLEIIEQVSPTEIIFAANAADGSPLTELSFRSSDLFGRRTGCIVLRGCPYPWKLAGSLWNTKARRVELTLRQQKRLGE